MQFSRDKIIEFIANSSQVKKLYRSAMDNGFWPDVPNYEIEKLSGYLGKSGIDRLEQIDGLIDKHLASIERFLSDLHSHRCNSWKWRLNSIFLCQLVLIFKFPESFDVDYLIANGWDREIAEIVLGRAKKDA